MSNNIAADAWIKSKVSSARMTHGSEHAVVVLRGATGLVPEETTADLAIRPQVSNKARRLEPVRTEPKRPRLMY
jgi:hypothetical protein